MHLRKLFLLLTGLLILLTIMTEIYWRFSGIYIDLLMLFSGIALCGIFIFSSRKYIKLNKEDRDFIFSGGKLALINALIGNTIFAIIDSLQTTLRIGFDSHTFESFMIFLATGSILLVIPAFIGGLFLAYILRQDVMDGIYSEKMAVLKAILIGLFTGIGICGVVFALLRGRIDFNIFLQRLMEVSFIASLAAGWTGRQLSRQIQKYQFEQQKQLPPKINQETG